MKKFDSILLTNCITNIFYTATYPYIYKMLYTNISEKMIALTTIISCLSIIIFSQIWNQYGDRLYKFFPVFCIGEFIASVILTIYLLNTYSYNSYYLYETFSTAIITRQIFCGMNRLKRIRYTDKDRELFDNKNSAWCSLGTIIGSLIAMVLNLNFETMLWIATFGNAVDNLSYSGIYFKEQKKVRNKI